MKKRIPISNTIPTYTVYDIIDAANAARRSTSNIIRTLDACGDVTEKRVIESAALSYEQVLLATLGIELVDSGEKGFINAKVN